MTSRPAVALSVCVFCASSERIDPRHLDAAAEVGDGIARRGWTLVSGGGSVGSMGAVARAARRAGGRTVGVIPRALVDLEVADHYADELVVTEDMRERKGEMDRRADAFVALPGGLGTLEELLEVWVAGTLGMHAKPVVVLDPDGTFSLLREQVDRLVASGFVRPAAHDAVRWAATPTEALDLVDAGWRARAAVPAPAEVAEEMLEAEP